MCRSCELAANIVSRDSVDGVGAKLITIEVFQNQAGLHATVSLSIDPSRLDHSLPALSDRFTAGSTPSVVFSFSGIVEDYRHWVYLYKNDTSQRAVRLVQRLSRDRHPDHSHRHHIDKMKNKPRDDREEDTGEMIEWRSMSQEEMDQCWKMLAEKIEEEVLDKCKVDDSKGGVSSGRGFLRMEACAKNQEVQNTKVVRRLLGNNFRIAEGIRPAVFEKHARRFDRKRGDEAAAKNEDYAGCDEED